MTAARPLAELYAHGVTAKNRLWGRLIPMDHTQTKGTRMVEPMRPDLAEAMQLLSEAQQVNSCTSCTIHTQCSAYALVARHEEPIGQHSVRKAVW